MNLQKINWKLQFTHSKQIVPFEFFRTFSEWIPDSPEIFIDVADYQHVNDGPKIILVGHHVDYSLEENDGNFYFVGAQKKIQEGSNQEKLKNSFQSFVAAKKRLLQDSVLGQLSFNDSVLSFIINDRALALANEASFNAIKKDLSTFADDVFGVGAYSLEPVYSAKGRFLVNFKLNSAT